MSEPVFINTKVIPEKKKVGRPRKLKDIPNGIPSIEQQFRIFKNITEPYLLQKAEIPEKDFITKMKEMEYDAKTADEKAVSSFSQLDVRTDNFIDQIAMNKYNNNKKQAQQARLKLKAERKQLAVDNKLKKDILKNKQSKSSKKEQEILTSSIDYKVIPKGGTIDGGDPIFEYKNIADPAKKLKKTSQGNDRQTVNMTGNISYQGIKESQYKIANPREINKADVKRKEYKLATPSQRVVKIARPRNIN